MSKFTKTLILWMLIIGVFLFLYNNYQEGVNPAKEIKYSEFVDAVKEGAIRDVEFTEKEIKGDFKKPLEEKYKSFKTYNPYTDTKDISELLKKYDIPVSGKPPSEFPWGWILINALPVLLIFILIFFMIKQAQTGGSQAFSFGRSKAKLASEHWRKVTFNDVAGVDEAVEELKEVVDFLKSSQKYKDLGARIPKGVLLLGAPGTGKTLLGRAIAGEANVPFFYISGSDFVEMFVGVGASRVRDLFDKAKKSSPSIIFVDEIDAVGRQRGAGLGGGHDEREQTLNQLLVEMDGFESNSGVIMIAATNRPDVLDPALLRPGRFDRHVVVDKPDIAGRKAILDVHSKGKPFDDGFELEVLARRTPGFTGADLENLLNEAALLAARNNRKKIAMHDCEEAIDRALIGPERKSRIISDKEKDVTAYHEAGHALLAKLIPEADPVRKVTILPRGMALGVTWQLPLEDKYTKRKNELLAEVKVLLGGRVAEDIVFEEITTGAANDLKVATEILHNMICKYGMSENLGPLTFGRVKEQIFLGRDIVDNRDYSEDVARLIDKEIKSIADQCYKESKELLTKNRDKLEKIVKVLKEKEVLEGHQIDKILNGEEIVPAF